MSPDPEKKHLDFMIKNCTKNCKFHTDVHSQPTSHCEESGMGSHTYTIENFSILIELIAKIDYTLSCWFQCSHCDMFMPFPTQTIGEKYFLPVTLQHIFTCYLIIQVKINYNKFGFQQKCFLISSFLITNIWLRCSHLLDEKFWCLPLGLCR